MFSVWKLDTQDLINRHKALTDEKRRKETRLDILTDARDNCRNIARNAVLKTTTQKYRERASRIDALISNTMIEISAILQELRAVDDEYYRRDPPRWTQADLARINRQRGER